LIGDSPDSPRDQTRAYTANELRQMDHAQRVNGRYNGYEIDELGIVIRRKNKALVYAC